MLFENSEYYKKIRSYKLELSFGNFYLTEKFVLGELHEGVHFDWEKAEILIAEAIEFYGNDQELVFISNRVNDYSIDPENYRRLEREHKILAKSAIVIYNASTSMNASIEKQFAEEKIVQMPSLTEAIDWASQQ